MKIFFINMIITASAVSFTAWLSGARPGLAGFLVAMPLATLLVLPMSYYQHSDPINTVKFAKMIFLAMPISLLFFVPYFLAERFHFGFWTCYLSGITLLVAGYFLHKKFSGLI